jgi:hypothetical protein
MHRMARSAARAAAVVLAAIAFVPRAAAADDGPCAAPTAATLADRPGTGRFTSTGGSPCVVPAGAVVLELGVRRQATISATGDSVLVSAPLALLRFGTAPRLELALAPPDALDRVSTGTYPFASAAGSSDGALSAKWQALDTALWQISIGASYLAPIGAPAFTAGSATWSFGPNVAYAATSRLTIAFSPVVGTLTGADANGNTIAYATFMPSLTASYAFGATTLLVQEAVVSRGSPTTNASARAFIAVQHAFGNRLAIDMEFERNLTPIAGTRATALSAGLVWIARQRAGT